MLPIAIENGEIVDLPINSMVIYPLNMGLFPTFRFGIGCLVVALVLNIVDLTNLILFCVCLFIVYVYVLTKLIQNIYIQDIQF